MDLKKIDGLIFDLDGTLWDASSACAKAWNETFTQTGNGIHTIDEDFVRSISGLRIEKVFSDYFSFIPEKMHGEVLDQYKENELIYMKQLGGELYPGTREALTELKKKYRLFVVSNCLKGYIENFIAFHGLEGLFTDFESAGMTGLPKSDNIKLIVKRNSLSTPVYIGDTEWDQEAAQKAGVPFIYAAYGFRPVEGAELRIDSLQELAAMLK